MGVVEEVDFTKVYSSDSYRVALQKRVNHNIIIATFIIIILYSLYNYHRSGTVICRSPLFGQRIIIHNIMYFIRTVSKLVLSVYL